MLSMGCVRTLPAALFKGARPDLVMADFPEYATDLAALGRGNLNRLKQFAFKVASSLATPSPVRAVMVVGYADVALRVGTSQRSAFEYDVSLRRAESGRDYFMAELARAAGHPSVQFQVRCDILALGSANRVVVNAATEADMRKNRRVELFSLSQVVNRSRCACG